MKPWTGLPARVRWHAGRTVALLGWPGAAAVLAAVAVGAMQWWALPDMHGRAMALRAQARHLAQAPGPTSPQSADAVRLARWRERFEAVPPSSAATRMDALARLHATAQALQLQLQAGSYRVAQGEDDPIVRMEIVVQGRGSYSQLRSFALRSLQDPALALNAVRWDRPGTADAALGGEFQFTLYMRVP